MNLIAPTDDGTAFPTLGPQVVDWMHQNLVFGPGDKLGEPLVLDAEQQWFIWRFYELYPRGHAQEGRRRFQRCALSLAKGLRKTELAACIAAAELHPDAPVRFGGWKGRGNKLAPGHGITDPFVVMVAFTEEQSNELAYAALCEILKHSVLADDFDIGLERIERKRGGRGKAVSIAGSPSGTDGARTTFQLFDETHHMDSPRQKQAQQTMLANMPKRPAADPWTLETTTAPAPGTGSIAEATMDYAREVIAGRVPDPSLFFYHRQASNAHDLKTRDGRRAAVIEASGPSAAWRDIDRIVARWDDPTADKTFLERVWLNRMVQQGSQAFDVEAWKKLTRDNPVKAGDLIAIGFDGSREYDSTGIVCTHIATGFQWVAGLWERPVDARTWCVPEQEVDDAMRALFSRYTVWRLYADPPYWREKIAAWRGVYGEERVIDLWTGSVTRIRNAIEGFDTAIKTGAVSHDGDANLTRHIGNSRRDEIKHQFDEQGKPLWKIRKERPDSPHKIDLAVCAVLSWEARTHAIAEGMGAGNVYLERGVLSLADYV
jgi:hypothetical protein